MEKTKKKRSSNKLLLIVIIIIVLALILSYFFKFPFNFGNGNNGEKESSINSTIVTKDSNSDTKDNSGVLNITVKAEKIFFLGEEVDLETLKTKLNQTSEDMVIQLIDNGATLGTYEEVEKILEDSKLPFTKIDNIKQ